MIMVNVIVMLYTVLDWDCFRCYRVCNGFRSMIFFDSILTTFKSSIISEADGVVV